MKALPVAYDWHFFLTVRGYTMIELKNEIINLLKKPQSECSVARLVDYRAHGIGYFNFTLVIIPAIFEQLKRQNLLECVETKAFDCGAGNGLAIEHFYKLK